MAPTSLLLIAGLALLAAAASLALFWPRTTTPATAADSSTGSLAAKQAVVDLGRVPFDRQVEARYELTNTSSRPIRLTAPPQVQTLEGCWPAQPAVSSTTIQPGQILTLRYPFIMHPGMGGPHRFEITLRTDSPERPTVTLTLVAQAG